MVLNYKERKKAIVEQQLSQKKQEYKRFDESDPDVRVRHKALRSLGKEIKELEETLDNWDKTPQEIEIERFAKEQEYQKRLSHQEKVFEQLREKADKMFKGGGRSEEAIKWILSQIDFDLIIERKSFTMIPMTEKDTKAGRAFKRRNKIYEASIRK